MKLPPGTRHALSLQELRAFVQPAFVFDENVPVKIPVQTPRRQNRMTIWLQQMHLGIHQLPGHGFIEEKPYPCTASAVIFMSRALQARGSVDGSVIVVRK